MNDLPRARPVATALLLIAVLAPLPALADDDDRRGREGKQEFWDGPCKVEVEWKRNGDYKQERKCQGGGVDFPEAKEAFREGGCRVEREWKKNGDFKEERKCDRDQGRGRGRDRGDDRDDDPRRDRRPPPGAVVYPPWVVIDRGEPVYRPGREPAPPRQPPAVQCQSEAVGRLLGGVVGAVIGSQIGRDGARAATTIGGAVVGVLIGGEIGRRIDAANQDCIGRTLEFGATGQRVAWSAGGTQYAVTPGPAVEGPQGPCRDYRAEVLTDAGWQQTRARACRAADGSWAAAPR